MTVSPLVMLFAGLNLLSLIEVIRLKRLPRPFPWEWALAFAATLFVGGLTPLGTPNKFYVFIGCLSAVIVGSKLTDQGRWPVIIAIGLCVFIAADSLRLIPTPDVVMSSGETFGPLRRPYALEHPNVVATWIVLLPFGPWSIIGVLLTQSRAALLGVLVLIVVRYVPQHYRGWSVLIGLCLFALATLVRPGTMLARLDYWQEGTRLFLARPITGWGSDSYSTSLHSTIPEARAMNAVTPRTGMPHAHSALITLAAENGLMGLIPFVALIIGVFNAARTSTHPARWGLLAFAVQHIFDDLWLHPITILLLGLMVGVCVANPSTTSAEKPLGSQIVTSADVGQPR